MNKLRFGNRDDIAYARKPSQTRCDWCGYLFPDCIAPDWVGEGNICRDCEIKYDPDEDEDGIWFDDWGIE